MPDDSSVHNKAKVHEERIGQVKSSPNVKYYLYPKGKIMVYIICSDRPFKLETDNDVSSLFAFFGQVRDRLLYLLSDVRERIAHQHCSLQMSYKRICLYDILSEKNGMRYIAHQKSVSILSEHLPNVSV